MYEAFPGATDNISLFYDLGSNKFVDEDGNMVFNIHAYITPNELYLFRLYKGNMYFYNKEKELIIELVYPIDEYLDMIFWKEL